MFQIVPRSGVKAKPNSYYSFFPIPTCPPKYSQYISPMVQLSIHI